ncbi:cellulose synthase operon protein YhjQ/BcsQ [Thiolapillus sp.]
MNHKRDGIPENQQQTWEDVRGLLRGSQGLSNYHELSHRDELRKILQRWPLLDLEMEHQDKPDNVAITRKRHFNVTLVTGTASSVGATTVVANLARALQQQGKKVMVADLSARQDLSFHLGGNGRPATPAEDDADQGISLFSARSDHGGAHGAQQQPSHQLATRLSELPTNTFDHVLIDCPWHTQAAFQQACALAGHILLVTTAELIAFQQIGASLASMASASQSDIINPHLLINRFNFAVPLQRDIHTLLHSRPPVRLAPVEIPQESRIVDSLAQLGDIVSLVPGCDAAHNFRLLGNWLLDQTMQQGKTVA